MSDHVELSFPARAENLYLARQLVSAVSARRDFTIEEIEDLQLAVDELCLSIFDPSPTDRPLYLAIDVDGPSITVRVRLDDAPAVSHGAEASTAALPEGLSKRILDALVDEHGSAREGKVVSAWLTKVKRPTDPPS